MRKFKLYSSLFLAQISVFTVSTTVTWTSPMLPKLQGDEDNPLGRRITTLETSVIASLPVISAALGSILCGILSSRLGRKTLLISLQLPCLFSFCVMAFAGNIWLLYLCRFLHGMSLGGVLIILPMYTCEIADAKHRGIVGSLTNCLHHIGPLLTYCLGPFVSFFKFNIIFGIFSLIYTPFLYFCVIESPYYFLTRDLEKARKLLKYIRHPNEVDKNLKEMQESIKNKDEGTLKDMIKSPELKRAMFIAFIFITFHNLTGNMVVHLYTQSIFENSGGFIDPAYSSIIIGVAQLAITVIFSPFTDLFPRKKLLIFSHVTVALTQIPFGVYYILKDNGRDVSNFSFIPLVCLVLFVIFVNIGVNPLYLTYLGEIFPLRFKGIAISMIITYGSFCGALVGFSFNFLVLFLGIGTVFLIFSFCGFLAFIFFSIYFIETKGKTLEQIQDELCTLPNRSKTTQNIKL